MNVIRMMGGGGTGNYWSSRAQAEYEYKGEKLYTITAAPYYVARRNLIVKSLKKIIHSKNLTKIADLGCGDGEYLNILHEEKREYTGIDISKAMLDLAAQRCSRYSNVDFEYSETGIQNGYDYDMVYIVAVLAHVDDNTLKELLENAFDRMQKGGVLCICEQIAPHELEGNGWKRRTFKRYVRELESTGFCINEDETFRIDFKVHRKLFERKIAKLFYKKKSRIECNKDKIYLLLSRICVIFSLRKIHKTQLNGFGYAFIAAEKK